MAEGQIKHTDIVEENIFDNSSASGEKFLGVLNQIIAAIKNLATLQGKKLPLADPATIADLQKEQEVIRKTKELNEADIRLRIEKQKATKALSDSIKAETSAYQALQNQYTASLKTAKDLAAQYGAGSVQAKAAAAATLKYNNELKAIDYSLGNHQRNVGNYNEKLGTLGKTLKGFGGLGRILGNALGIDTTAFDGIREAGMAIKDLKHVKEGETLAEIGNTEAKKANVVATEAETVATGLSTGGITLLIAGLVAAAVAIYEYITANKESEAQEKANQEAEKETLKVIAETAKLRAKTADEREKIQNEEDVALGKITESEGKKRDLWIERNEKVKELIDKENETIKNLADAYGIDVNFYGKVLQEKTAKEIKFDKELKDIKETNADAIRAINEQYATDALKVDVDLHSKQIKEEKNHSEKIKENHYTLLSLDIEAYKKYFAELIRIAKEAFKATQDDYKKAVSIEEKQDVELENDKIKKQKIQAKQEHDHRMEEIENLKIDNGIKQQIIDRENKIYAKKIEDIDAENRQKRIDEEFKTIEQITQGIKEGLAKRSELQQQSDQRDIDMHTRMLDVQAKLAAEGKANVLGETMAETAKAEEKKLQDAKKAARQQMLMDEFSTFEKTFASALKKHADDPQGGWLKALGEAMAAEGAVSAVFSKMIAGFYEGTEDTGTTDSPLDAKGGRVAVLHDNERVVPKRLNDQLDGMSNDELVSRALTPMFFPKIAEAPAQTYVDYQVREMTKEIKALRNDMASRPVQSNRLERLGEWTEQIHEKNVSTIIHHKKSTSRPSLRLNG